MTHETRFLEMALAELKLQTREGGNGMPGMVGYAAVYDSLSKPISGAFREKIAPGAFSLALARSPDVRCLLDHQSHAILGRSASGTLELRNTVKGLQYVVPELPKSSHGQDIAEALRRGDISHSSFAFSHAQDSWEEQFVGGQPTAVRTLHDLELHDVSPVTYPAYTATEVGVRNALASFKGWIDQKKRRGYDIRKAYLDVLERLG